MTRKRRRPGSLADDLVMSSGEDLSAAPPELTESEAERRKYAARKARERAESEQLRASKLSETPTAEDLVADMLRVSEDEDVNPYAKFRTLSAQRYRLYGHYPIEHVWDRFGEFNHALEIAGLRAKPGTRIRRRARANASRVDHAARYMQTTMAPYVVKSPPLERDIRGGKLILSISDTHATYLDPFTWWAFLSACRVLKPDVVVLNGDILEGSEISSHPKVPGATIDLQVEFDFAETMFAQLREAVGPDALVIWVAGNHGLDRLARYLSQEAPALAGLRSMRFDRLAGIDRHRVMMAQGGTFVSPEGDEGHKPGVVLYGCTYVRHGVCLGKSPGHSELAAAGMSGITGHVHRGSIVFATTAAERSMSHMTLPMGCRPEAGRHYMRGASDGWQGGFGSTHVLPGGLVRHSLHITDGGACVVEGHYFERRRKIKPMPVTENWLAGFDVP